MHSPRRPRSEFDAIVQKALLATQNDTSILRQTIQARSLERSLEQQLADAREKYTWHQDQMLSCANDILRLERQIAEHTNVR